MSFKNASFNLSDAECKCYGTNFTKLRLCDSFVKYLRECKEFCVNELVAD